MDGRKMPDEEAARRKLSRESPEPHLPSFGGYKDSGLLDLSSDSDDKKNTKRPADEAAGQPAAKKALLGESSMAQRMMERMGYKEGTGLGKEGQGRVEPVALSTQRGRRGLGLKVKGFEGAKLEWDMRKEVVEAGEIVEWLSPAESPLSETPNPDDWIGEGPEKKTIDDENQFCDPEVLKAVIGSKSVFDSLDELEMRKARGRCNPYESIGKMFFQNRAALKMANIDAACDFIFTEPKTLQDKPMVLENQLLYFADVCAGPGGFTEYVLWRKGWSAKGFGFTLRSSNDFKLEDFYAASTETFEPCYGINEDGDVYKPANIAHFRDHVLRNSDGQGVHFMMADGGFSVEGQENIQEILSHRLYLCQCLVAISIVRPHGHFVVKLFDVFTPFSVGLLWLMRRAFHQICIFKPNTSRPANSERYLVCKWRHQDVSDIEKVMWEANLRFEKLKDTGRSVISLVPRHLLDEDEAFIEYVRNSSNEMGLRQAQALAKIQAFCIDTTLFEPRQADMKSQCLANWKVPEKTRVAPRCMRPDDMFVQWHLDWRSACPDLPPAFLAKDLKMLEWRCFALNSGRFDTKKCTLFLSVGRGNVFFLDRTGWRKVDLEHIKLDLPAETLLFGEIVNELRGEAKAQRSIKVLHVMDAFILGGKRVDTLAFEDRLERCKTFAKAVDKPTRTDLARVYVKEPFRLDDLDALFEKVSTKKIKHFGGSMKMCFMLDESSLDKQFFMVGGLLFVKIVKDPWTIAYSKKNSREYWFNCGNGTSTFEHPMESVADFDFSVKSRLVWWWDDKVSLAMGEELSNLDKQVVHRSTLVSEMDKQKAAMGIQG